MTLPALPLFVKLAGRAVILLGESDAADAKRRLLERAGAAVAGEEAEAALAIVALEDEAQAVAAVERLRARGILVNAVDRPALCDFTLPAIVDRSPVLVAIGTAGVSAGLAAALRQRLEALLPARLGRLAEALHAGRAMLRERWPDPVERRRMIAEGLAPNALLDPLGAFRDDDVETWTYTAGAAMQGTIERIALRSPDPDELTLREARLLANADRVFHAPGVPAAVLDRARADAARIPGPLPADPGPGLTIEVTQ